MSLPVPPSDHWVLSKIEKDLSSIREDVKDLSGTFVHRGEYETRVKAIDREVVALRDQLDRGLTEITNEIRSGRGTWWQVMGPLTGLVMGAVTLITLIART